MSQLAHPCCQMRIKHTLAIEIPKFQPEAEVADPELRNPEVRSGKTASVARRAASLQRPELRYLRHVVFPVVNMGIENRSQFPVLADIGIKRADQFQNSLMSTKMVVKWPFWTFNNHVSFKTLTHPQGSPKSCGDA